MRVYVDPACPLVHMTDTADPAAIFCMIRRPLQLGLQIQVGHKLEKLSQDLREGLHVHLQASKVCVAVASVWSVGSIMCWSTLNKLI